MGDRTELVEVDGCRSSLVSSLGMGLCQGERSSGLLFALHTNLIPQAAKNTEKILNDDGTVFTKLFIDDTTALVSARNYIDLTARLQETFDKIEEHLIELGMAINASKTQMMVFNPDNMGRNVAIKAGGKIIPHQKTLKILGFTFSQDAKMDEYIWKGNDNLIRSIHSKIFMLRVIKPFTSEPQLANIGNLTINSQIRYVAPLWSLTGATNLAKIQSAQTKAARAITWHPGLKYSTKPHRQELLLRLGWKNVQQMSNTATVQIVKLASKNQSSEGINLMFAKNPVERKRSHLSHFISTFSTKYRKGINFLDRGRSQFNQLPLDLRDNSRSRYGFKRGLKSYINDLYHLPRH